VETTKTWDQFIARQVEATLRGEATSSEVWRWNHAYSKDLHPQQLQEEPAPGLIWLYVFGRWGTSGTAYWWVNLTQKRVLLVRITP
jgi:hypothetical protein